MKLEVLHVPDCPNLSPMLDRLRQATDLPVSTRVIDTDADAAMFGMAGSPTLLIDGRDPFSATDECTWSVSCRVYRDEAGRIVSAPSVEQVRAAITSRRRPGTPAAVLSAWRTRAVPLGPVEKAMHQAILRAFATTGRPPSFRELDTVVASGPSVAATLDALHTADAIRLSPGGGIAVAYPFSAVPTRHRVHVGDQAGGVDVYAMCAIDALGIGPMLGQDTRIESVDTTTDQPITVTTTSGQTRWEPDTAVVFVGADGRGGPSADCCCDYLNFFTDDRAATAWTMTHPDIPGHILDRAAAEALAEYLFGTLLADQEA